MRINTLGTIKNYEGKDVLSEPQPNKKQEPVTLRDIFTNALNSQSQNEIIPAEKKAKIYQLTTKLYKSKEVDLTSSEIVLIEEQVAKFYNAMVYGRVLEALGDFKEEGGGK